MTNDAKIIQALREVHQEFQEKHLPGKHDQKSHGHEEGRSNNSNLNRSDSDPDWQTKANKADEMAKFELNAALPGVEMTKIHGNYAHQPRIEGKISGNVTSLVKDLRAKGWKAPTQHRSPGEQTLTKGNHELNLVDEFGTGGGLSGKSGKVIVHYAPSYDNL